MTPEDLGTIQSMIESFSTSDKPFMILVAVLIGFLFFMAIKFMGHIKQEAENRDKQDERQRQQTESFNQSLREIREDNIRLFSEERAHAKEREAQLLRHLDKNTEQIGHIAETLKEVQSSFYNLDAKVDNNFRTLTDEINEIKEERLKTPIE